MQSKASDMLLLGTALVESNLEWLEQKGEGEALGVYQIEASTHRDVQRYLNRHDKRNLKDIVLSACFYTTYPSDDALIHNLRYATLIARLKYWMAPERLPGRDDAVGLAQYHKKHYNTAFGKTDVDFSSRIFERIINEFER